MRGAEHLPRGLGGLEPEHQGVCRTDLRRSRFQAADGVLGEFVQATRRNGGVGDGESDSLEFRERFAELHPGLHVLASDLQRLLDRADDPPGSQREMQIDIGGWDRAVRSAQGGRHQKRPELRGGARRRLHVIARAVEVGGDPIAGQVAVVDPGRLWVHQRESGAVDRQQFLDERVRQCRCAGRLAEHGRGHQILGGAPDVEVECSDVGQRGPGVVPQLVLGLGPQRGLRPTEPEQPLAWRSRRSRQCLLAERFSSVISQCFTRRPASAALRWFRKPRWLPGRTANDLRSHRAAVPTCRCPTPDGPSTSNSNSATC